MKIVLVYDNKFEYTTGFYCKNALEELGHEVYYINPIKNKQTPKDIDFYLNVDDDSPYFLPDSWKPNIYWVSDTHRGHIRWRFDKCKKSDILFTSQKSAKEIFSKEREQVYWLPHACDPKYHFYEISEKIFDIGFVGNINSKFHQKREKMIKVIKENFKNVCFTNNLFLKDMAKLYSESKIVFNCTLNNDINMRLFEGMCSGSLVITDNIPELYEVISKDSVVSYENEKDLLEKINYYLINEEERNTISENGYIEAINKHTYKNRMEELIKIVGENL